MKATRTYLRVAPVLAAALILLVVSLALSAGEKKEPFPKAGSFKPIKTDPKTWVADQVDAGKDVYLSANYLFQVMKLRSQKVLMEFEASTLYPTLTEVADGLKETGPKGQALVYVEVARKLLNPDADVDPEVTEEVEKRVTDFLKDPQNTPRGHYTTTEELKRYFRGMQFLAKATFDVQVDKQWFAQRMYMLFPFEAAVELVGILSDPKNGAAREKLDQIYIFYDRLVGPSDLPSFHDLLSDKPELNVQVVLEYANKRGLPKINKEMGVGIQCLGERFAPHQFVIENLSQTFLAQDTAVNRDKAFEVLRLKNVLVGRPAGKVQVPGLAATKVDPSDPNISYYNLCLAAIIGLPEVKKSPYMMNAAAASLTALAEQTILVTKQTTLVPKSAAIPEDKKKPVNIYVQPGIGNFLKYLGSAEERLSSECGVKPATNAYKLLTRSSVRGKPIRSDSPQGIEVLDLVSTLPLDPTVTADVFFFAGQKDKAFLQWAIGPFEVEHTMPNKAKVMGMEMIFFEGWHDAARPGAKNPMTNEEWRALFEQGHYKKMNSLLLGTRSAPGRNRRPN